MVPPQDEFQLIKNLLQLQLGQWQSLLDTSTSANVRVYCEAKLIEIENEISLLASQQ